MINGKKGKVNVTLRTKLAAKGMESLYLDFYPKIALNGKTTRRHFLKLKRQCNPKSTIEKRLFKEVTMVAEQWRNKFYNEVNKSEIYSLLEERELKEIRKAEQSFNEFLDNVIEKKEGKTKQIWLSFKIHFIEFLKTEFFKTDIKFSEINLEIAEKFRSYLLQNCLTKNKNKLSKNSAATYFAKFKSALKDAHANDYIKENFPLKIRAIKESKKNHEYLTKNEIGLLDKSSCEIQVIKRAALFAVSTGLRISDILNLKYSNIKNDNGSYRLIIVQAKSGRELKVPLNLTAIEQIDLQFINEEKLVFEGIIYSSHANKKLEKWIKSAGINRKITWHTLRHSYGSLLASINTPIPVIRELLGHANINSTMRYISTSENQLVEAVNKINLKTI
jgi:integrase